MDSYQTAADYAERIERELHNLKVWRSEPLPAAAYASDQPFYLDTMTLYQWLQFILLPSVRKTVEERGEFPAESYVGAHAVREFDGVSEAAGLIQILVAFDEFIEGLHRGGARAPAP